MKCLPKHDDATTVKIHVFSAFYSSCVLCVTKKLFPLDIDIHHKQTKSRTTFQGKKTKTKKNVWKRQSWKGQGESRTRQEPNSLIARRVAVPSRTNRPVLEKGSVRSSHRHGRACVLGSGL
jgi:hypothetical protein